MAEFSIGAAPVPTQAPQQFSIGPPPAPKKTPDQFSIGATPLPSGKPSVTRETIQGKQPSIWSDMWSETQRQGKQALSDFGKDITDPKQFQGTVANNPFLNPLFSKPAGDIQSYLFAPISGPVTALARRYIEPLERKAGLTGRAVGGPRPDEPLFPAKSIGDTAAMLTPLVAEKAASVLNKGIHAIGSNDVVRAVQSILAPTSMSHEAGVAEKAIRRGTGEGDIATERAAQTLLAHSRTVGNLPVQEQRNVVNYIENRSSGVPAPTQPGLKAAADTIAKVYDITRKRIQYILGQGGHTPQFINDYYVHMWKEKPAAVSGALNNYFSRQGSGRNLKERTIPTIADGIAAGLTPRIENPVEATMAYVRNMNRFLATHDIQNELRDLGYMKFYAPGQAPPGWVPVDGILTEKTGASIKPGSPPPRLSVARRWPDGRVQVGRPGETHGDLGPPDSFGPKTDDQMGFTTPDGQFLSRTEARDWVKKNAPSTIPDQVHGLRDQLEARTYDEKIASTPRPQVAEAHPMKLHAPEDVARVYNNWISKGFEQGDTRGLYEGARFLANGLTGLKMGLSGFHGITMANEAATSELARAVQNLTRVPGKVLKGEFKQAGQALGRGATALGNVVTAPVTTALRGRRMGRELLGVKTTDAISKKVNDAFVRSGGRLRMDPFYSTHAGGSFLQSMRRGTFATDVKNLASEMFGGNLKAGVELAARSFQTAMAPLFEVYIPSLKRGAFGNLMHDWVIQNPHATQEEIDRAAIKIQDTIDNRFGELVQDNLFWDRKLKQAMQIMLFSPTWKIGTAREIGGGLVDIGKSIGGIGSGEGISPRTAYNVALAGMTSILGGVGTYLMTGKKPEGRDFIAPRTGGTDIASGQPERLQIPGYSKDVLELGAGFLPGNSPRKALLQYGANALNPGVKAATDIITNTDYRGLPLYPEGGAPSLPSDAPTTGSPLGDTLAEDVSPISIEQLTRRKKGSAIGPAATALGFKPSPAYITSPERMSNIWQKINRRDWLRKRRSDERIRAQEEQ